MKLLEMEVLFGRGISNSWEVSWSFILIGWLTVTQTRGSNPSIGNLCLSRSKPFEIWIRIHCFVWENLVSLFYKEGGGGYCGGLLMQFVVADTDSKITQMLKRSSWRGWKFDGHFFSLIFEMGVEEFPEWLSVLVQVQIWVRPSNFNFALKHCF